MIAHEHNDNFWKTGTGKEFIKWSGFHDLEANDKPYLFKEYDGEVDKLVEKWLRTGEFGIIMKSLHGSSIDNLPEDYQTLRQNFKQTPSWVDSKLIQAGCELSERSGLVGLLVLRNFALLSGYNYANLTKTLIATGAFDKGPVNRLSYTLNFWVNVSRTKERTQEDRLNACLRIRLVHCASRLKILEKYPDWDVKTYGIPINYADMIATNIAFTVFYLYGLYKLNFDYSEKEELGIFHLWKYVTYMLGVPEGVIPSTKVEALKFFKFWTKYQNAPDQDSVKLTEGLLSEDTPMSLFKLDFTKRDMAYIHKSITNYLIDEEVKRNLNIPKVRLKSIIPNSVKLKNEIPVNRVKQIAKGNKLQLRVLNNYKNTVPTSH